MSKEINLFEQASEETFANETQVITPIQAIQNQIVSLHSKESKLVAMLDKLQAAKTQEQEEIQSRAKVKRIVEALLFAGNEPISFDRLREITDTVYAFKPKILERIIQELQEEYITLQRSFRLEETPQGFVLHSCEEFGPYIEQLYRNRRGEKLSQASTEVLAIIAHKQPITRPAIDSIRGVDSSGTMQNLLERGLVEVVGRQESPGRPSLYAVTPQFLQYYGLRDLKELEK